MKQIESDHEIEMKRVEVEMKRAETDREVQMKRLENELEIARIQAGKS
jgi:hypothetical protein